MKKLLLVIITGLSLFIGASFADNIQATLQPATQTAISGSAISLQLQIANTTGVVCTVDAITLYHAGINLTYMSLIPLGPQV